MKHLVVRNIERTPADTLAVLQAAGTSTVHEAMGRIQLMKPYLRPVYAGAAIAGSAVTVLAQPGDNWMIHVALEQCQAGDVLVVGVTADNTDGMFGELLGTAFKARGVLGVVIDAGCRDVRPLQALGFPVWSRAVSAKGTVKETVGSVNRPVVCAGVNVQPGDAVVADDDGVVVVPRAQAAQVAHLARQRQEREAVIATRYAAGELGLDMSDMRGKLERAGLRYVDTPADADREENR